MTTAQLRKRFGIPDNAFVYIPEGWHVVGELDNGVPAFQYRDEKQFGTEVGLLLHNIALFRVNINTAGEYRDFYLFTQAAA